MHAVLAILAIVLSPRVVCAEPLRANPEEAFKRRIADNIERLREPVANEIRFLTKVALLSDEQVELLQRLGWLEIERGLWPNEKGSEGRLVLRQIFEVNGKAELRENLKDAPQIVARRELVAVLKDISREAWQRAEAERQRLDRRQRWANVLVQVAAFDDALLLADSQREMLGRLLFDRWPQLWRGHVGGQAVGAVDFALSAAGAMDLFSVPEDDLKMLFRPSQIATFRQVQLPTKLESVVLREPRTEAAGVLYHGLPLPEEGERLHLLLQRLIEDVDAHADLDEPQKEKLMIAGKLDIARHEERRTEQQRAQSRKIVIVKTGQIGGAKVPLPPIFSNRDSMFFKALRQRLDSAQPERLAAAQRERRRFHLQAVLLLVAAHLADVASLTDDQETRIVARLNERWSDLDGANGPAIVRALWQLRPEDLAPLLDDWQLAGAQTYLEGLAKTARQFEDQQLDRLVPMPGGR